MTPVSFSEILPVSETGQKGGKGVQRYPKQGSEGSGRPKSPAKRATNSVGGIIAAPLSESLDRSPNGSISGFGRYTAEKQKLGWVGFEPTTNALKGRYFPFITFLF
jgi:hypothetical protein